MNKKTYITFQSLIVIIIFSLVIGGGIYLYITHKISVGNESQYIEVKGKGIVYVNSSNESVSYSGLTPEEIKEFKKVNEVEK